jgi:hypothetical protein
MSHNRLRPRRNPNGVRPAATIASQCDRLTPQNLAAPHASYAAGMMAAAASTSSGAGLVVVVSVTMHPLGVLPLSGFVRLGGSLFPPSLPSRALQGPLSVGEFLRGGDYPSHRSHDPKMLSLDHAPAIANRVGWKVGGKCARPKRANLQGKEADFPGPPLLAESARKVGKCAYRRGLGGALGTMSALPLHLGQRSGAAAFSGHSCPQALHRQNQRRSPLPTASRKSKYAFAYFGSFWRLCMYRQRSATCTLRRCPLRM